MTNNRFLFPAIAAMVLALLFPIYWYTQFGNMTSGGEALIRDLSGLNPSDLVFLLIGILNVYIYLSLKKFLNERHEFNAADIPLVLLIVTVSIFVFGSLLLDSFMYFFGTRLNFPSHEGLVDGNIAALIISTIVFGGLNIALGFILFTRSREFLGTLKAFAVVLMIEGFFEVTVIFSVISIVIFPLTLIILAILFLREPEVLEVV
tara:strand:- start:402 stop:1016 length:615 start_codon:yes stop_codon:yes gene_type:complete